MDRLEKLAARIITRSKSARADEVLRAELKVERLEPRDSAAVAGMVFSYFRWRGWLEEGQEMSRQLAAVRELDFQFSSNSDAFSLEDLMKAIPPWARDEVAVSREWLVSLQTQPTLWLRAKRGTGEALARKLGECIRGRDELGDTLEYQGIEDLFRTQEFHAGDFEVQDIASQFVGLLCDPKPGETWWDACAGEGGKLLHLSELM